MNAHSKLTRSSQSRWNTTYLLSNGTKSSTAQRSPSRNSSICYKRSVYTTTAQPVGSYSNTLDQEIASVDNDIKSKFNQYNTTKTNLASQQRSRTGNLSQRSLASIVNPRELLAPDASEYLQQHLLAIPNALVKDYLKTYESLSPMVVPRSSTQLAKDDEFTLFAVTTFKKHGAEFVHKAREKRWIPREWKFTEGGKEAEDKELEKLEKEERKVWGEALRLARTGYSDAVMAWIHILALRVFVETVLRYGLPLNFVCGLVKVSRHRSELPIPRSVFTDDFRHRRTQKRARRQSPTSTAHTHISAAMLSAKTRRAESQRTTRPCQPRCPLSEVLEPRTTTPTSFTSLKLRSLCNIVERSEF